MRKKRTIYIILYILSLIFIYNIILKPIYNTPRSLYDFKSSTPEVKEIFYDNKDVFEKTRDIEIGFDKINLDDKDNHNLKLYFSGNELEYIEKLSSLELKKIKVLSITDNTFELMKYKNRTLEALYFDDINSTLEHYPDDILIEHKESLGDGWYILITNKEVK